MPDAPLPQYNMLIGAEAALVAVVAAQPAWAATPSIERANHRLSLHRDMRRLLRAVDELYFGGEAGVYGLEG